MSYTVGGQSEITVNRPKTERRTGFEQRTTSPVIVVPVVRHSRRRNPFKAPFDAVK